MNEQQKPPIREVTIPATNEGLQTVTVKLRWVCPQCGKPRGEVIPAWRYDGSQRVRVDKWLNSCNHIDYYEDVREEARTNGLNRVSEWTPTIGDYVRVKEDARFPGDVRASFRRVRNLGTVKQLREGVCQPNPLYRVLRLGGDMANASDWYFFYADELEPHAVLPHQAVTDAAPRLDVNTTLDFALAGDETPVRGQYQEYRMQQQTVAPYDYDSDGRQYTDEEALEAIRWNHTEAAHDLVPEQGEGLTDAARDRAWLLEYVDSLRQQVATLTRERDAAHEALRPFAALATPHAPFDTGDDDDVPVRFVAGDGFEVDDAEVMFGDFRNAAAVLAEAEGQVQP